MLKLPMGARNSLDLYEQKRVQNTQDKEEYFM